MIAPQSAFRRGPLILSRTLIAALMLSGIAMPVRVVYAADGTWTNQPGGADTSASGSWNTDTNWLDDIIADGSGFTADFSTLDISGTSTDSNEITLDAPRTIGSIIFGNTNTATAGSWNVNDGGAGNVLTLAGTDPTITVNALGGLGFVRINAVIAGSNGLVKDGGGLLILAGSNTYTGTTTINGGTLRALNANAIGGDVVFTAGTLNIESVSVNLTGNVSGAGQITKTNSASVLTLSGNNTHTGGTNLGDGTLVLGSGTNNGLGTGTFTIGGGSVRSSNNAARVITNNLSFGSNNVTYGAASGALDGLGDLTFTDTGNRAVGGSKNWAVNNSTTVTFNNNWTGNPGHNITKTGTGTLIFNGNFIGGASGARFRGNITVNNGVLILNGTKTDANEDAGIRTTTVNANGTLYINGDQSGSTGAVTVNEDGTLGGSGIVGGDASIAGTLTPGNSAGLLTFNADLTLQSTAEAYFEINGLTLGTTYDSVSVLGDMTYAGTLTLDFGASFVGGEMFQLFTVTGASLSDFATVDILNEGYEGFFDSSTGVFTLTAVPEPSIFAMLGLGPVALLAFRRRRARA